MAVVSDSRRRQLRTAERRARRSRPQRGAFLLEALIAALVFSFGSLAMVGLQARAVRHANDAQYRGEAAQLAQAVLAEMGATDVATLAARFDARSGGPGYAALLDRAKNLPGVSATQNSPDVLVGPGPSSNSREISIVVYWAAPGDPRIHRYATTAVVGGR
jgi:type IV pilus assembly protein PilV